MFDVELQWNHDLKIVYSSAKSFKPHGATDLPMLPAWQIPQVAMHWVFAHHHLLPHLCGLHQADGLLSSQGTLDMVSPTGPVTPSGFPFHQDCLDLQGGVGPHAKRVLFSEEP